MKIPKLAIFDIDGTISTKEYISPEVLTGFEHLHELGCITTVSTGRGYIRLRGVLSENFDKIVSPEAPIILEHGSKIVHRDGGTIFTAYFSDAEMEHVIDFIRANISICRLVWFNPSDASQKMQLWCSDPGDVQKEQAERGEYADIYTSSIGKLRERLMTEPQTNITVKLKSHVHVENLKLAFTRTETNVIFQDGNMEFVKSNTNKGLATLFAAKSVKIDPKDVLVAGNAINDIEMLDLDVGTAVLVSLPAARSSILSYLSSPENIVTVDTPEALGNYLNSL